MRKLSIFVTSLAVSVLVACAANSPSSVPGSSSAASSEGAEATVHVHAAGDPSFRANAYLVETVHGVVAVDAPFTVSESRAFRAELDAINKPLLAVLVTHAHPDHVNGITELVRGTKAPIYVRRGVDTVLRSIDAPKRAYWTPIYKEEYPTTTTFPDHIVDAGAKVTLDGITFEALDAGPGESADETVWIMHGPDRRAFVGDLVMNRVHPWLAEGRSAAWLASLTATTPKLEGVTTVYPGHGAPGDVASLEWQRGYLNAFRAAVREQANGKRTLDDAAKKAVEATMKAYLPGAPLEALIAMSVDAVATELAGE